MPTPARIVVARKQRRSRKPLPQKPTPACGPIVLQVRGQCVPKPVDPEADERARMALERMVADARAAARGE